jgi:hypothetical protein
LIMKNYNKIVFGCALVSCLYLSSCSQYIDTGEVNPGLTIDMSAVNGSVNTTVTTGVNWDSNKQYIGGSYNPETKTFGVEYRYRSRGASSISCQLI